MSVSRPLDVIVLNFCVRETNDIENASMISTILAKSVSDPHQSIDLIEDNAIGLSGTHISKQRLQLWRCHIFWKLHRLQKARSLGVATGLANFARTFALKSLLPSGTLANPCAAKF